MCMYMYVYVYIYIYIYTYAYTILYGCPIAAQVVPFPVPHKTLKGTYSPCSDSTIVCSSSFRVVLVRLSIFMAAHAQRNLALAL